MSNTFEAVKGDRACGDNYPHCIGGLLCPKFGFCVMKGSLWKWEAEATVISNPNWNGTSQPKTEGVE